MSESEDISSIVQNLVNGGSLDDVPEELHPRLLVPLSMNIKELLVAHKEDQCYHIRDIINSLRISKVPIDKPKGEIASRAAFAHTAVPKSRLPIISRRATDDLDENQTRNKQQPDLETIKAFWDNEIKYYKEMRRQATEQFNERQKQEMRNFDDREYPRPNIRPTVAANLLREKTMNEKISPEQAKQYKERASIVDVIDRDRRFKTLKLQYLENKRKMEADQEFQRKQFNRLWDQKYKKLQQEMNSELKPKPIVPFVRKNNRRPNTQFRKSCPVSVLQSFV